MTMQDNADAVNIGNYRSVLGRFPSGVAVVTTSDDEGSAGFTCQSFSALSLEPPLVLIAPARSSNTWPRIEAAGHFCVNVMGEDQHDLSLHFASKGDDKFIGVEWQSGILGAPLLAGAVAYIECRLESVFDGGDHLLVTGRVLALDEFEGEPLVFHGGRFRRLAAALSSSAARS